MDKLNYEIKAIDSKNKNKFQSFWRQKRNQVVLDEIRKMGIKKGSKILEMGCGLGNVSFEMARMGYDVTGIDIDKDFIKYAKKTFRRRNLKFYPMNLEKKQKNSKKFDVVFSIEVLEHLKKQDIFLKNVSYFLKEDGILILTTPNYSGLWNLIEYIWGRSASHDWSETHYVKYRPGRLENTLNKNNFQKIRIYTFFYLSQFLPFLSYKISDFIFRKEIKYLSRIESGALLIGVFRKKRFL